MLTDSNDSPPICESSLYRASLDEGAIAFDPPLIIKVRDADTTTDISYRYENITSEQTKCFKHFEIVWNVESNKKNYINYNSSVFSI